MDQQDETIAAIAERHGLTAGAVRALADGMRQGGGGAQWNHADLGGMGQWLGGGMLQIGDMFNHDLKARVAAALNDIVEAGADRAAPLSRNEATNPRAGAWWPSTLGEPTSTGAQNAMRYACFPDRKRLVVERDGRSVVYDTGSYRLTGFAQAQGADQTLTFSGPDGRVTLDDLTIVG